MRLLLFPMLLSLATLTACTPPTTEGPSKSDTGEDDVVDVDGDGYAADVDCDDADATIGDGTTYYIDEDADTFGYDTATMKACTQPDGYVAIGGDCNDQDATYHPGADEADCEDPADYNCDGSTGYADADSDGFPACQDCDDARGETNPAALEYCNGIDDDCNGTDDDNPSDAVVYYADHDADTYGDADNTESACAAPEGFVENATDCNDDAASVHPGADEHCDNADENCDGQADESPVDPAAWYADGDKDGYGDADAATPACDAPADHVADATDCDDLDANVHPGADEYCTDADENCDGSGTDDAVDTTVYYADDDEDTYGDAGVTMSACTAPSGYVSDDTDCDDSTDLANPDLTEVCNDGLDNDCDESDNGCSLAGNYAGSYADQSISGTAAYDFVSSALAVADDVDGDSSVDLWIGAYGHDLAASEQNAGRMYLMAGPLTGSETLASATTTITATDGGDDLGFSAANLGDFDGDGLDDLVAGAYGRNVGSVVDAGTAYVFTGIASGALTTDDATTSVEGAAASDYVGYCVAGPGDVTGDGTPDAMIGAYAHDASGTGSGAVAIIAGGTTGDLGFATGAYAILTGIDGSDSAGYSLAGAGDVNGDGVGDVVIGANARSTNGSAYLVLGPISGTISLSAADATIDGLNSDDALGNAVAGVGDTNDDGVDEFVVAAHYVNGTGENAGAVYLYSTMPTGSVSPSAADATFSGGATDDYLGRTVGAARHINGDAYADIVIGATGADNGSVLGVGYAYLFYGPVSGAYASSDADATFAGDASYDALGASLAAGDIDESGADDLLLGAMAVDASGANSGRAFVYYGGDL